jgi:hypothetical protein
MNQRGVFMAYLAFQIPRKHLRETQQREAGALRD